MKKLNFTYETTRIVDGEIRKGETCLDIDIEDKKADSLLSNDPEDWIVREVNLVIRHLESLAYGGRAGDYYCVRECGEDGSLI